MNRTNPRIVKTAFVLALGVLVVNAVLTYRDVRALHANANRVAHTREVIAELQRTLSILKDAEMGERGYLLTEDPEKLEPYQDSIAALGKALDRLSALTADNPHQQAHVEQLRRLADQKVKELKCTVALAKRKGRNAALEAVQLRRERDVVDDARASTVVMEEEEQRLLVERSSAYETAVEHTVASSVITTGIAVALLVAVAALTRHTVAAGGEENETPWKKRKPLAAVRRIRARPAGCAGKGRTTFVDSTVGVFVVIAVAILGLCAVLLLVSRF